MHAQTAVTRVKMTESVPCTQGPVQALTVNVRDVIQEASVKYVSLMK